MVSAILVSRAAGRQTFFWNIDANVGLASPNKVDDVQLVQLGYFVWSKNDPGLTPDKKAAFAAVKVGVPCSGDEDDTLVQAIRAHQKDRGGTQDGHVSTIQASNGLYHDSGGERHGFMLIAIVNRIFDALPKDFPRIDKHPSCPPALKDAVLKVCVR